MELTSLQFIAPNGAKRLLGGGRKQGCFIAVSGDEDAVHRIVICEGWATGCTLAENDPDALVLSAIDAGNLKPVAVAARRRWPSAELIIAGDDDRQTPGNPGATKAHEAAIAADGLLALPQWPENAPEHLTDFNDLNLWLLGSPHE
jgi:putative DNA primase/helicase